MMLSITRRGALLNGALLAALPFANHAAFAAVPEDQRLYALLQHHADLFLRTAPEEATGLGLDTGANAALRGQLRDRSAGRVQHDRAAIAEAKRQLGAVERSRLTPAATIDHDVAAFVYDVLDDIMGRYGFVDTNLRPSPYVVSQMNGAYYWLPDFIGSRHPIETAADVAAYFSRLEALGTAIDQETARIRMDAANGIVPPRFIIARTASQIAGLRDTPAAKTALIQPAIQRAAARGLGDLAPRAEAIFKGVIAPALTRQIEALNALAPGAVDTAGVWRLPDGEAYYRSALRANTTVAVDPGELHAQGLDLVAALTAQLEALLAEQGLTSGPVAERMKALDRDPRFRVSADDAGRARLLAAAEQQIAEVSGRLPRAFGTIPDSPVLVRRTPVAIEGSSPGAFYDPGAPGQPGVFSLNLKRPQDLALWRLPTLVHHETIPGHHLQHSVLEASASLPLFRRLVSFSAYTEGWALYAEQVAGELGVYDDKPAGRIGLLQSQLFRAARIVVDTGIHHKRWTREQAVSWMVEHAGEPQAASEREIDRYCVYPGQACSFMVGANKIVELREAARARLGKQFDVRGFHDLVLKSGPLPMEVLETEVQSWSGSSPA